MYWIVILVAGLLTLVGGIIFLKQLNSGLTTTALHDNFNWGLYVQGFFYFSALAVGILVFMAVATLFEIKALRPLVEIGAAVSFSCLVCAGGLLISDLGRPFRSIKILTVKNFASPLTWDFYMLTVCGILNLVFLAGVIPSSGLLTTIWAILCLIAALGYVTIHTLFFLSRVGAGFKSVPFLGLDTLAQSLWGGLAIVCLIALASGIQPYDPIRLLLILTILTLITLAGAYIASPSSTRKEVNPKVLGLDTLILFTLIAIYVVSPNNTILLAVVSLLILLAVFLEKSHLIRHYQLNTILPLPYSQFDKVPKYKPTAAEWMLAFGSIGVCILLSSAIIYLKGMYLG